MTNTEEVFHSGRLPQAMRASMSIPAAFAPVRIGDKVLVDGGLRNNFPVDVARDMGADIVIGITLSEKSKTAEEIHGTMDIVGQIIDMNCVNKYEENKALTDLYMNVDPRNFSTASFTPTAIDSLIRYGEEEAMRHWDEIIALKSKIGIDDSFRPVILQPRRPQVLTEKQHITGFTFENMTPHAERFLRQKFHLNKTDSIDAKLEQSLTTSMRIDLFYQSIPIQVLNGSGHHGHNADVIHDPHIVMEEFIFGFVDVAEFFMICQTAQNTTD
jgi:NTE family protein